MCGIAGFTGHASPQVLEAMVRAQEHRGPDSWGFSEDVDLGVSLGMTRLAIQDILGGSQPMTSHDGSLTIVFNGEIFNAPDLRRDLDHAGYKFQSDHSDTEVLLQLYHSKGEDMVLSLNGMFAFVILDRDSNIVFGARDRSGIKPLYFSIQDERFSFASELKALLVCPWVNRYLDKQATFDYFTFQCIPSPRSPYEEVQKLPPGTRFTFSLADRRLETTKYWEPTFSSKSDQSISDIEDKIYHGLVEATERWMLSDVPLGFSLSGGIDSSLLVGIASQELGQTVETFSLGFSDSPEIDETYLASVVSKRFTTQHHQHFLSQDDLVSELPEMVSHLDEPYGGGLPSWFVFREMSKYVKVAIVGTGGDELFGNYGKWKPYESAPAFVKKVASNLIDGAFVGDLLTNPITFLSHLTLRHRQKKKIFSQDFLREMQPSEELLERLWVASGEASARNAVPYSDFQIQLPEEFLFMTDRFSMAHSIEARTPFLDNDFVSLVFSIPAGTRTELGSLKGTLTRSFKNLLPAEVIDGPKRGFVLPYAKWLRGALRADATRVLSSKYLYSQGIFCPSLQVRLLEPFLNGDDRKTSAVWTLLMYQKWFEHSRPIVL